MAQNNPGPTAASAPLDEKNVSRILESIGHERQVTEGTVIPASNVPITAPQAAFGKQLITFADITNHNWRVTRRRKVEKKRVFVAEENAVVDITKGSFPMSMATLTIRRQERDAAGNLAPREHSRIVGFPFYTFDNDFTKLDFSPKDVALAIWQMREMWGKTIDVYQMTDAEVSVYYTDRSSPEMLAAREAMGAQIEEKRSMVDSVLMSQ